MISQLADATDATVFGGKAAQLGMAICGGLPVPDGIALSSDAVDAIAHEDAATTADLVAAIAGLGLSAVRSSALGEDSADASFAGAHLSVLAVLGPESITAAVRAVHASGAAAGAVSYRAEMGLDLTARMAVVVQSLVDADTVLERTLGDKDIAIRPQGEVPVDPRLVDEFCLDELCLVALDALATKCDRLYGSTDHDIEFAFRNGEVFLLQRRPITRA